MEKITRTIYRANDGTEFETMIECLFYEKADDYFIKNEDPFYKDASLGKLLEVFRDYKMQFIEEGNRYHFIFENDNREIYTVYFSKMLQDDYLNLRITSLQLLGQDVLNLTRQDKTMQQDDHLVLKAGLMQKLDEFGENSLDYIDALDGF